MFTFGNDYFTKMDTLYMNTMNEYYIVYISKQKDL